MCEFLTTKSIQSNLESIIVTAKKKIILVSPYFKLSSYFHDSLIQAANRGVLIKMVYGKSELHRTVLDDISKLKNVEVYYYELLHAKCYLNESKMIITSMNFHEGSEKNREMGMLIDRDLDKAQFDKALGEIKTILESTQTKREKSYQPQMQIANYKIKSSNGKVRNENGYCIRCATSIKLNLMKPYCTSCYESWSDYFNYDYIEKVCHNCKSEYATQMERPQCLSCYQAYKKRMAS